MCNRTICRMPYDSEVKDLALYFAGLENDLSPHNVASQVLTVESWCVSVCEHWIDDGPGYVGKVITLIPGSGPQDSMTFIYNKGKLEPVCSWGESNVTFAESLAGSFAHYWFTKCNEPMNGDDIEEVVSAFQQQLQEIMGDK